MALKIQRLYYSSRNLTTGLGDVKADIYKDGVSTPVATDVPLSELDATNSPGLYKLELSVPDIVSFGGSGEYIAKINSASKPALAVAKFIALINDNDDLALTLVSMQSSIDAIATAQTAMQSDVTSIKSTVEDSNTVLRDGNIGNANLKTLIEQVISAVSSVQNNTRFVAVVPERLVVPAQLGTTSTFKIDARLFDMTGNAEDPDNDEIFVSVKNVAGIDRTNLIEGYTSGPVALTKNGVGIYEASIKIADTTDIEQLRFSFDYAEGGSVQSHPRVSETIVEELASGLALQATLLDVLTDTAEIQPKTATILNMVNDPISGLVNLKTLIDIVDSVVDDSNAELKDASHGLANIKLILDSKASQDSIDAINTILENDVKGADFDNTTDSLSAISERSYTHGNAV